MMINKAGKVLYFVDQKRSLHCTLIFKMKDKVNSNILLNSLNEVLTIYKLVNKDLLYKDETLYFVDNEKPINVVNDKDGVLLGSNRINNHYFCVSYFENNIRISISHAITDGGGLFDFSKTLILNYLEKLYNKHLGVSFIRRVSDGTFIDDQIDFHTLDYSNIEKKEATGYNKDCFILPESIQKGEYTAANLYVNEDELMSLVKKYQTNVSSFAFYLFSKAVYRLNKNAKDNNVLARITADIRKALGISHSQLNCSLAAHLSLNYQDIANDKELETLKNLKSIMKSQLESDVIKYEASLLASSGKYKPDLHPTISISYMGKIDFEEMNQYIDDFSMIEGEFHKINFFAYNNQFKFTFHIGEGSEKYAKEMSNILKEYGINSLATKQEILPSEKE